MSAARREAEHGSWVHAIRETRYTEVFAGARGRRWTVEIWGRVDMMAGPLLSGGGDHLQDTHPHSLSTSVGWAAEGLLRGL